MTHDTPFALVRAEDEARRRRDRELLAQYDPVTGRGGCGDRRDVRVAAGILHLPVPMLSDTRFSPDMAPEALNRLRFEYDFEFWAVTNIKIKDKTGFTTIDFTLNTAQRRVLEALERQRVARKPIRLIVLKARQMGCSTLIQIYMMWIQLVHRPFWNSAVCAQATNTTTAIHDLFELAIDNLPEEYYSGKSRPKFKKISGASSLYRIHGRDCVLALSVSSHSRNIRGADLAMAHLTEVAFWPDTRMNKPENTIASICASILPLPYTIVALESTANGVGNYFHNEWCRAADGKCDKEAVFVPWFEIDAYRCDPPDPEAFWNEMSDYELALWNKFCLPLDRIYWYHLRSLEYPSEKLMMAEYPSTDIEAFAMTSDVVFDTEALEDIRDHCRPADMVGELEGLASTGSESLEQIRFKPHPRGALQVWELPDTNNPVENERNKRYIVAVDIGGRSAESDWSVIAVFDRSDSASPRLVAQWRGHCDHDILAWNAARIAKWYCNAILMIESNTIETDRTEGDHGEFILRELQRSYRNLYKREPGKPGFHTNRVTKNRIINDMIGIVRNRAYIERDNGAIDEAAAYERKRNGATGAINGHHDDRVITRAMALSLAKELHLKHLRALANPLPAC